jgi:branched-chain amino acid transport system permease protein
LAEGADVLDFILYFLIVASIYGVVAISLNMQAGVSSLMNFGQVAFFGIGAYATGIAADRGWGSVAGICLGIAVAALAGAGVGRLGRTLAAEYWAIATLALAELVRLVALNENWLTGGANGISGINSFAAGLAAPYDALAMLALCLVVLAGCFLLAERLTAVQFGRVLRLLREQEALTESLGHDVVAAKARVLAVSAGMAALAGALYTHYISFVGPGQLEPFETFLIYAMVVVGGLASHRGAVLGAFLIQLLYTGSRFLKDYLPISSNQTASLRVLLIGAALLACLLVRPAGLVPERLRRLNARR